MSKEVKEKEPRNAKPEEVYSFEIVLNGVKWPNTFGFDIQVDRTGLEEEFAEHSRKYAYYSTLCAIAKDQEARDKRILELLYANIDAETRAGAFSSKVKLTEKMVENSVKTDERYQVQHLKYLDSKCLSDKLKGMEHAFAQRKEMLISLGAHDRIGATDLRVKATNVQSLRTEDKVTEENVDTGKKY